MQTCTATRTTACSPHTHPETEPPTAAVQPVHSNLVQEVCVRFNTINTAAQLGKRLPAE